MLAVSFAFAASALFLLLRGRPTPTVRAYFYLGMCEAFVFSRFAESLRVVRNVRRRKQRVVAVVVPLRLPVSG